MLSFLDAYKKATLTSSRPQIVWASVLYSSLFAFIPSINGIGIFRYEWLNWLEGVFYESEGYYKAGI